MSRLESRTGESSPSKPRKKKIVYEPAQPHHIVPGINEVRVKLGLEALKTKKDLAKLIPMIVQGARELSDASFVALSFLSLVDEWDGVMSAPDLLRKWMADPSRRSVILGPGKYIHADFVPQEGKTLIVVFTLIPFQ
jgi:hypothetical protein